VGGDEDPGWKLGGPVDRQGEPRRIGQPDIDQLLISFGAEVAQGRRRVQRRANAGERMPAEVDPSGGGRTGTGAEPGSLVSTLRPLTVEVGIVGRLYQRDPDAIPGEVD
jgi:hypothetical protein